MANGHNINGLLKWFIGFAAVPIVISAAGYGKLQANVINNSNQIEKENKRQDEEIKDVKDEIKGVKGKVVDIDKKVDKIYNLQILDLRSRGFDVDVDDEDGE